MLRNWLIHALGGVTFEEHRELAERMVNSLEVIKDILKSSGETNNLTPIAKEAPRHQPVPRASVPWSVRKKKMEIDDREAYWRAKDEAMNNGV